MNKDIHAFPHTNHYGHKITGMTMRDYFATHAMQGLIPQFRAMFMDGSIEGCWVGDAIPELAKEAFLLADAMMKAREQ